MKKENLKGFRDFTKDLKLGHISNVITFNGMEDYLIKWAVERLVSKYVNSAAISFDYNQLNDENFSVEYLEELYSAMAMLSEKRVVLVRNIDLKSLRESELSRLKESLEEVGDNALVILTFYSSQYEQSTKLKLPGKTYTFNRLEMGELKSFVSKQSSERHIHIEDREIRYFIDQSGYFNKESDYYLYNFINDIEKLGSFANGMQVTKELIDNLISGDEDSYIFSFLDAVSSSRRDKAIQILKAMLYSGEEVFKVLALVIGQLEIAVSLKELLDQGINYKEAAKFMKVNEFRCQKLMTYVNQRTLKDVKKALIEAYSVEEKIKTGLLEADLAIEMMVFKI